MYLAARWKVVEALSHAEMFIGYAVVVLECLASHPLSALWTPLTRYDAKPALSGLHKTITRMSGLKICLLLDTHNPRPMNYTYR
jgi:hypothetical protein